MDGRKKFFIACKTFLKNYHQHHLYYYYIAYRIFKKIIVHKLYNRGYVGPNLSIDTFLLFIEVPIDDFSIMKTNLY